jgi:hypothetical protein
MDRRTLFNRTLVLVAIFSLSFLNTASADVVNMSDFGVTLNGGTVFDDTYAANQILAGGAGTVLPSGANFPDGSPGLYLVMGTVTETGHHAVLNTAQGDPLVQSPPFFRNANANIVTLLTGPPGSPFALTPSNAFATSGLFSVSVPSTPGGFYQINLSDRVASNFGLGDVISMTVVNCTPGDPQCGSNTGPYVQLVDANALTNTIVTLAQAPLNTSNQQILLELSHPTAGSDTVVGSYAYVNGGVEGSITTLGSYNGLFEGLDYTQAGFVQLAPVPEPSTIMLLAGSLPGVLGFAWFRRQKVAGCSSRIETSV